MKIYKHYEIWRTYGNRYWPRKYLIDIDGFIVYDHIGEGAYEETEKIIQELLKERGNILGSEMEFEDDISLVDAEEPKFREIRTPELYFGYGFYRKQMGNKEGLNPGNLVNYELPDSFEDDKFYLEGEWKNNKDNMELFSEGGRIILNYKSKNVNLVAGSSEKKEIKILLDGEEFENIEISDFDLYNIIEGEDYSEHKLEIIVPKGVMVYTFTFG